jgi:hypothetical protein
MKEASVVRAGSQNGNFSTCHVLLPVEHSNSLCISVLLYVLRPAAVQCPYVFAKFKSASKISITKKFPVFLKMFLRVKSFR